MQRLATVVAVGLCLMAVCATAQSSITYNVPAAIQWLNQQACSNSSQNPTCNGNPCYDDELTARTLAAGGAVNLSPTAPTAEFQAYSYNNQVYDLTTQNGPPNGLYDYLVAIGWYNPNLPGCSSTNENACFPAGAVIMTTDIWQEPIPLMAIGNGLCSCGSPLNTNAPHCGMPCSFFAGTDLFFPPAPAVIGPIIGSYTPNNQTYQDLTMYPNMFNTPETAVNEVLSVLEVGWTADDASTVLNSLNFIWQFETAIPVITWMPYAFSTWSSPTPNEDIVNGKYDAYIEQFLTMLNGWVSGKRAYLRFAPQPNGDWFPWNAQCPSCSNNGQHINQTIASYVAMYQYVLGKVQSTQYQFTKDNLQIIFDVNNADAFGKAEQYYPGADYVDWFMVTGMNWGNTLPGNQWSSPSQVFTSMVQRLRAIDSSLPIAVSGATTSEPNGLAAKGTWITEFFQFCIDNTIKMLLYHNADSSTDLAMFGGSKGPSTWTSPLSQIVYNVYPAWSNALNNFTFGVQGANSSNPLMLSRTQFTGNF